jgi:hypothetical protein
LFPDRQHVSIAAATAAAGTTVRGALSAVSTFFYNPTMLRVAAHGLSECLQFVQRGVTEFMVSASFV